MALKATVFKAQLNVADMERHYYAEHDLTLAQHPSETDERLMLRLLAFALHAQEELAFTRGISTDDEPDLWVRDLTGHITLWIELGLPDEKRVRKACNRADQVVIYAYGGRAAPIWWTQNASAFKRFEHLTVVFLPDETMQALARLAARTMSLQANIQDGQVWFGSSADTVLVEPEVWQRSAS